MLLGFIIAFIAGVMFVLFERRNNRKNRILIQGFISDMEKNSDIKNRRKMIYEFFESSGFRVHSEKGRLVARKKIFSIGYALIFFSLGGAPLLLYLLYFLFLKRPSEYAIEV